jgi:hypothetical protein
MKSIIIFLASLSIVLAQDVINIKSAGLFPESIDFDTNTNSLIAGSLLQGILVSANLE